MSGPAFIFTGGGTGGHLFPAIAIAEQLAHMTGGAARAAFLCSDRPIDEAILRGAGVEFRPTPAAPPVLRPRPLLRFLSAWGPSLRSSRALIAQMREDRPKGTPEVQLVAMGGFVAPPAVRGAMTERAPVTLVNLDAVPGMANRWVARRARTILDAAPAGERPGWTRIPPIVRASAIAADGAGACRERLGLDAQALTLLVTGASQGARSINRFMDAFVERHAEVLRSGGWQVVHQTGPDDAEVLRLAYAGARVAARVEPFFVAMGDAWGAADLAVSRAGAGSVAEAWANRVPTLFLPYPYHADEHQRHNAAPLAEAGGARIESDRIEPDANVEHVGAALLEMLTDPGVRGAMRHGLGTLGPADGAARAATALLAQARA